MDNVSWVAQYQFDRRENAHIKAYMRAADKHNEKLVKIVLLIGYNSL